MVESGKCLFLINLVSSLIRLPTFIVLAYLEMPELAKVGSTDGQTDRQTERICNRYMPLGKYQVP